MTKSNNQKDIGKRIQQVRFKSGKNQISFAQSLRISNTHLSLMENGHRPVGETLLELIICLYGVDREWLYCGKKTREWDKDQKDFARDLLVTAAVIAPAVPFLSGTIAAGVGAAAIVNKICVAYGAKNISRLAKDHLNVDRSTIDYWIKKDKVPNRIVLRAIEETDLTQDDLTQSADQIIISRTKFTELVRGVWRDENGKELTDTTINAVFEKAMILGNEETPH